MKKKDKKNKKKSNDNIKVEEASVSSSWKQTTIDRKTMFPRKSKPMQQDSSSVASIANSFDDFEKPPPGAYSKVTPSPKKNHETNRNQNQVLPLLIVIPYLQRIRGRNKTTTTTT
jgi:hypothetical protein